MRYLGWAALAAVVLILAAVGAAAASTGTVEAPTWEWIRDLSWPAAVAAVAFSPLGRAVAGMLSTLAADLSKGRQNNTGRTDADMTKTFLEIAASLKRTTELQIGHGRVLERLQEGMTILLDRSR